MTVTRNHKPVLPSVDNLGFKHVPNMELLLDDDSIKHAVHFVHYITNGRTEAKCSEMIRKVVPVLNLILNRQCRMQEV